MEVEEKQQENPEEEKFDAMIKGLEYSVKEEELR